MKYENYFKPWLAQVEKKLDQVLPPATQYPAVVHQAMRYAVFPAGKRFRPLLAMAACEAVGGKAEDALLPAVSAELIHSYSLVHDDLPALDNDDERRGQPTCHKKFGEAMAILAGDGLLTLAFHVLALVQPAARALRILDEMSTCAGTYGMIGGQAADLTARPRELNPPMLEYISIHKTGKLIKASAVSGAIAGGADKAALRPVVKYAEALGLAFQYVDDLLDGDGQAQCIKPAELQQKVRDLVAMGMREIRPFGRKAEKLQALADYLLKRIPRANYVAVDR